MSHALLLLLSILTLTLEASAAGRASLDAGDRWWTSGDRARARTAWTVAAQADDPATRAQAEARLLLISGNLGLAVHGPRADHALATCEPTDAWCAIAQADLVLFARAAGVPMDVATAQEAAAAVQHALPAPAQARLVWAGVQPLDTLLPLAGEDAMVDAIISGRGAFPAGPGSWVLGAAPAGGTGSGVGGGVQFIHPDLGLRGTRFQSSVLLTSRLAGHIRFGVQTTGRAAFGTQFYATRSAADRYDRRGRVLPALAATTGAQFVGGLNRSATHVAVGPAVHWDWFQGRDYHAHGLVGQASYSADRKRATLRWDASATVSVFGYRHEAMAVSLTSGWREERLVAHVRAESAPWSEAPFWRLPSAGGGTVLRHGPIGRFRDRHLAAAVAEWRMAVDRTVGAVVFVESALIDGLHGGAGAGLRLRLPPRPTNSLRLDVGVGDGGVGMSVGWGEMF